MSITKLDPEHLARILEAVDGQLVEATAEYQGQTYRVQYDNVGVGLRGCEPRPPTHVVFDCDGEILGRGLSADDAVLDALLRTQQQDRNAFVELRERVADFHSALARLSE
jgi:hypothetical protein